ncbi:META domain-containing protein [Zunongwangia endophytica]|uniref:META domain-containing protein n=1 Tax=Zunongwangia endophytica TaxID=1808945 RepID=A0ABV8H7M5_9FLAO|nr:META domain-containing protein [Zunongwangia endophytica]MDN3595751.1 META domain-containing protein [Zunongwangia endophytica]
MHLLKPLSKLKPCFLKQTSILAIFSLLFIVGCKQNNQTEKTKEVTQQNEETLNNSEISGEYSVNTLNHNTENLGNLIFDFNSENGRLAITTDCNGISAYYEIDDNNLSFSKAASTRKFCEGAMENEKMIIKVLPEISKFNFSEKKLELLSNDNEVLISLIKTEKSE